MGLLEKMNFTDKRDDIVDAEIVPDPQSEYQQDPAPAGPTPTRGKAKAAPRVRTAGKTTASTKLAKEVGDDLATMLEMGAVVWGMRDTCCAPVLSEQAQPIGEAIASILARNPRLLEKFANTDIAVYTIQILALGKALAPVGKAVYSNHVSKAHKDGDHPGTNGINLNQFPAYGNDGEYREPEFTDFTRP